ncbi:MAG: hypothetical protein JJ974_05885 [Phycisphaerales bacterium]|nr:hypothetical protein [Phycisphaerales bacterium]
MNTQELIENTMLYTLGLLEDSEISAYEAAFQAAPESVKQLVREESLRMSDFGDLMPSNEPDPALRELVISAVRAAMREQENEQRIAADERFAPAAVIGRIDPQTVQHAAGRQESVRRAQPKVSTSPKVHRLWRASTIGFAAATIALSVVWTSNNQTIQQATPDALISQIYNNIGAEYLESTLFDPTTQRVSLVSNDVNSNAVASVWHNPDWEKARLFVKNMKATDANPLRLVVLDEDGNIVREVTQFASEGELEDYEIEVNLKSDRRLAIYQGINEAIEDAQPLVTSIDSDL